MTRAIPPGKKKGQATGPRTIAGQLMDVRTMATVYGGTQAMWRARAGRHQVPFRRLGGRLIFIRREIDEWIDVELPGCSLAEAIEQANIRKEMMP